MNLINRRFQPFWYDVAPPGKNAGDGFAYDATAVKAIGDLKRVKRGRGGRQDKSGKVHAANYPAAMLIAPDGKRLGKELWGIFGPEQFVTFLKEVMKAFPKSFTMTEKEKVIVAAAKDEKAPVKALLKAARLHWELADFDRCISVTKRAIAGGQGKRAVRAELFYLQGRSLLCIHQPDDARKALTKARKLARIAKRRDLVDGSLVGLARALMQEEEYEEAADLLERLVKAKHDGRWVGAAMYYAGLCLYRQGFEEAAKDIWREHREKLPWDRLARRSAASLGLPESKSFLNQQLIEKKGWW